MCCYLLNGLTMRCSVFIVAQYLSSSVRDVTRTSHRIRTIVRGSAAPHYAARYTIWEWESGGGGDTPGAYSEPVGGACAVRRV